MAFPLGTLYRTAQLAQCYRISCQCRRHRRLGFNPWVRKISCRRKWHPTPIFLPGKSHGEKTQAGCSPWGHRRVRHDCATERTPCIDGQRVGQRTHG